MKSTSKKQRVGRPTKLVIDNRANIVAGMLLETKTRREIINYCVTNFGLAETSVAQIITNAYQLIQKTHQVDRDTTITLHIQHYYDLYIIAKGLGDTRGAVACLNSIEKLLKLTSPETMIQQNHLELNLKDMSLNDLKALLQINN